MMGALDTLRRRRDSGAEPGVSSAGAPPSVADEGSASLRRKRDDLVAQVAELHWDLGGLAYEMAIRDHFRLDVLVRKAAELQERDAELGELERVLSLQENAGAGECSSCGALRSRGAVYCWQCGTALMDRAPSAIANGSASVPTDGEHRSATATDGRHTEATTVVLPPGSPAS
jgi:hypothetical protein